MRLTLRSTGPASACLACPPLHSRSSASCLRGPVNLYVSLTDQLLGGTLRQLSIAAPRKPKNHGKKKGKTTTKGDCVGADRKLSHGSKFGRRQQPSHGIDFALRLSPVYRGYGACGWRAARCSIAQRRIVRAPTPRRAHRHLHWLHFGRLEFDVHVDMRI